MTSDNIRRTRGVHMLILTTIILLVLLESLRSMVPFWEYVLAFGIIWAWMLGTRYERAVIVTSGLATMSEIQEAEARSNTIIDWARVLGR